MTITDTTRKISGIKRGFDENNAQRQRRAHVGYERGSHDDLAQFAPVKSGFDQHGIDNRQRGGGQRYTGDQRGIQVPSVDIISEGRDAGERQQERQGTNQKTFLELGTHETRVYFRTCQESEQNAAECGEIGHPRLRFQPEVACHRAERNLDDGD